MAKIMIMPKIGVNMTEALIVKWAVKEGDSIKEGDLIFDAETDKAAQEIYATMGGIVGKIIAQEGESVEILKPVALMLDEGEKITDSEVAALLGESTPETAAELKSETTEIQEKSTLAVDAKPIANGNRVKVSPLAKKMAKDMGVDYRIITPSVVNARICKADVLTYASNMKENIVSVRTVTPVGGIIGTIPMSGVRKVIADRMAQSNQTIPKVPLVLSVKVEELIKWRSTLKNNGYGVSFNDLLVKVCSKALEEQPIINSRLVGNNIEMLGDINIGVAVDTEKGLVVPVIKNANIKGVVSISNELKEKINRTKEGKSKPDDITGGTFTITNLGMFEIEMFVPVINPPECCILGVGAIVKKPIAAEDGVSVVVKPMMELTLCFDHRIVDGAPAAKFLQRVKHLIECPTQLLN